MYTGVSLYSGWIHTQGWAHTQGGLILRDGLILRGGLILRDGLILRGGLILRDRLIHVLRVGSYMYMCSGWAHTQEWEYPILSLDLIMSRLTGSSVSEGPTGLCL